MRPNVDISWSIHGRLKDFAEQEDLTLTEAYERALTDGLDAIEEDSKRADT
jgi:hypothetical protein